MNLTQRDELRELFKRKPNQWIPLPEIMGLGIAQYGARILELRREGMDIENKVMGTVNGQRHTAFRYNKPVEYPYQMKMEGMGV